MSDSTKDFEVEYVYAPRAPALYAGRIRGDADMIINMCYQCPQASECAKARRDDPVTFKLPDGYDRRDKPDGHGTVWWSYSDGELKQIECVI